MVMQLHAPCSGGAHPSFSGSNEDWPHNQRHPECSCPHLISQALLDVYTIKREIGRLENFSIGLVGDLANGRTVRSLAYLLSMYPGVKMYFVAPEVVRMKEDIKDYLTRSVTSWRMALGWLQFSACSPICSVFDCRRWCCCCLFQGHEDQRYDSLFCGGSAIHSQPSSQADAHAEAALPAHIFLKFLM